jgi:hypothetical protein
VLLKLPEDGVMLQKESPIIRQQSFLQKVISGEGQSPLVPALMILSAINNSVPSTDLTSS